MSHFLPQSFATILEPCLISYRDFGFVILATLFLTLSFLSQDGPNIHYHCWNLNYFFVCLDYLEGSSELTIAVWGSDIESLLRSVALLLDNLNKKLYF